MKHLHKKGERILALDPMTRDLGFAVLEGERLVGWGVRSLRRTKTTTTVVARLLLDYRPTIVALAAHRSHRNRLRRQALGKFAHEIRTVVTSPTIQVRRVSAMKLRQRLKHDGLRTKHDMATMLSKEYPELRSWLPAKRLFYEKEDPHFAVFDALMLAKFGALEVDHNG